ncbi:MAG: hypothetical protein DCF20_03400 [Pseudanabaena sp.]|nr:MAG: hypothetical protein DCF20_03400 [Pseudanabaena sp.]
MNKPVNLIISGGQTGADWGGLLAAADLGIATGGLAPKGYRTELGENLELAKFGLQEADRTDYEVRTVLNVQAADATVVFADRLHSDGTKLTIESCIKHEKPYLINPDALTLHDWLVEHQVKVLNVAGNRESVSEGISDRTRQVVRDALSLCVVDGKLIQGHRVASGLSEDSPYAEGSISMQIPFFQNLGLDLSTYFRGTLNIDISPYTYTIQKPQFTFRQVDWTIEHPPEDFSFVSCQVLYKGDRYDGWVYYPHPETKLRHFQNPSVLEVIALPIADLGYGESLQLLINSQEVSLHL